jgi:DNA polymerase I-like protein with 3'-5' exonuclease and polymerase domains
MRRRGVRVHTGRLEEVQQWAQGQEAEALARVYAETGHRIALGDVWKSGAIAPALEHLGIRLNKTSNGQYNIDKDVLSGIDHPVAQALARARKTNKLRTTFAESVRKHMVRGRIHCSFRQIASEDDAGNQRGARYGRLSCTDPNLQQQPSRDDFAARWRSIYLPEEGAEWGSFDYSQQEPRWTTHFAAICNLPGARAAAQAYHDDPKIDNHQFMADLTELPRKHAKNLYLGLCYGEGGAKLSRECGFSTRWAIGIGRGKDFRIEYRETEEEARQRGAETGGRVWEAAGPEGQRVIDTFDQRAPFIRQLAKRTEAVAKNRGYIVTRGGRRLHFPLRPDGTRDWTHKALNRLIQGTSANQMKAALVALDKANLHLMLQVHDEACISVFDREREVPTAVNIMAHIYEAEVPFRVDAELGPSWGEIA